MINNEDLKQLEKLKEEQGSFPQDVYQVEKDFEEELAALTDFQKDFYWAYQRYCENTDGTMSYVLMDSANEIPLNQIHYLKNDFFEAEPYYDFFKNHIHKYPELYKDYQIHEQIRKILLEIL